MNTKEKSPALLWTEGSFDRKLARVVAMLRREAESLETIARSDRTPIEKTDEAIRLVSGITYNADLAELLGCALGIDEVKRIEATARDQHGLA